MGEALITRRGGGGTAYSVMEGVSAHTKDIAEVRLVGLGLSKVPDNYTIGLRLYAVAKKQSETSATTASWLVVFERFSGASTFRYRKSDWSTDSWVDGGASDCFIDGDNLVLSMAGKNATITMKNSAGSGNELLFGMYC